MMIRPLHILLASTFATSAAADTVATKRTRIDIAVTQKGFEPGNVSVPARQPVSLVFTRKTDATCTKSVVLVVDGKKLERELPLNKAVELPVTFPKSGKLTFACSMDMVKGVISVE